MKDTEDSTDGKNDLSEFQLVSLSGMSFMRRNNKLCFANAGGFSAVDFSDLNKSVKYSSYKCSKSA